MQQMLSEAECMLVEKALTEDVEPRKAAAYLCFHMGLSITEVCALRFQDIDLDSGTLEVRNCIGRPEGMPEGEPAGFREAEMPRTLPMPQHVINYITGNIYLYDNPDCFIVTGQENIPGTYHMQNLLNMLTNKYDFETKLSTKLLRSAFIRRALESGMDMYTLCLCLGIKQPNMIVNKYSEYLKPRFDALTRLEKYCPGYQPEAAPKSPSSSRRMKLMIVGAGSRGSVVREIAESIGIFEEIVYLDDDPHNPQAVDICANYQKLVNDYPIAIPSFEDCRLRAKWANRLEKAGFILPTLVDPMATVSTSAKIAEGVVVEAKTIISAGAKVGRNCIINAAAVLDKECVVGEGCLIGCACTITKDSQVAAYSQIPAGTVYRT